MVVRCAVSTCHNDSRYPDKLTIHSNVKSGKLSFHRFPAKDERRRSWIRLISSSYTTKILSATRNSRVCSNHFLEGQPTSENPDPTLFLSAEKRNEQSKHVYRLDVNSYSQGHRKRGLPEECHSQPVKEARMDCVTNSINTRQLRSHSGTLNFNHTSEDRIQHEYYCDPQTLDMKQISKEPDQQNQPPITDGQILNSKHISGEPVQQQNHVEEPSHRYYCSPPTLNDSDISLLKHYLDDNEALSSTTNSEEWERKFASSNFPTLYAGPGILQPVHKWRTLLTLRGDDVTFGIVKYIYLSDPNGNVNKRVLQEEYHTQIVAQVHKGLRKGRSNKNITQHHCNLEQTFSLLRSQFAIGKHEFGIPMDTIMNYVRFCEQCQNIPQEPWPVGQTLVDVSHIFDVAKQNQPQKELSSRFYFNPKTLKVSRVSKEPLNQQNPSKEFSHKYYCDPPTLSNMHISILIDYLNSESISSTGNEIGEWEKRLICSNFPILYEESGVLQPMLRWRELLTLQEDETEFGTVNHIYLNDPNGNVHKRLLPDEYHTHAVEQTHRGFKRRCRNEVVQKHHNLEKTFSLLRSQYAIGKYEFGIPVGTIMNCVLSCEQCSYSRPSEQAISEKVIPTVAVVLGRPSQLAKKTVSLKAILNNSQQSTQIPRKKVSLKAVVRNQAPIKQPVQQDGSPKTGLHNQSSQAVQQNGSPKTGLHSQSSQAILQTGLHSQSSQANLQNGVPKTGLPYQSSQANLQNGVPKTGLPYQSSQANLQNGVPKTGLPYQSSQAILQNGVLKISLSRQSSQANLQNGVLKTGLLSQSSQANLQNGVPKTGLPYQSSQANLQNDFHLGTSLAEQSTFSDIQIDPVSMAWSSSSLSETVGRIWYDSEKLSMESNQYLKLLGVIKEIGFETGQAIDGNGNATQRLKGKIGVASKLVQALKCQHVES